MSIHLLKHWINVRNTYHNTKFKSKDFLFTHKNEKPFRYDHLNNWLQNAMAIVAKKMKIKLDPTTYTAHT